MKIQNLLTLKLHKLSKKQFDREQAAGNIEETALYLTPDTSVSYEPQEPTAEQQAQARANTGAAPADLVTKTVTALTDAEVDAFLYVELTAMPTRSVRHVCIHVNKTEHTVSFGGGITHLTLRKGVEGYATIEAFRHDSEWAKAKRWERNMVDGVLKEWIGDNPIDFTANVFYYLGYISTNNPNLTTITATPLEYVYVPALRMVFFNIEVVFKGKLAKYEIVSLPYSEKVTGGNFFKPRQQISYPITSRNASFSAEHLHDRVIIRANEEIDTEDFNDSIGLSGWFFCD